MITGCLKFAFCKTHAISCDLSTENDGIKRAAQNVENTLLDELTIIGSVDTCKEKINEIVKNTKLKTIILGFDMPKDKYTDDFFVKLDKLLKCLQ